MDDRIWSRLPLELLLPIMCYASQDYRDMDERDAIWKKWLTVVRGNSFLHKALLSQQWEEVDFTWPQLLLHPDERVEELEEIAPDVSSDKFYTLVTLLKTNKSAGMVKELLHMDNRICPSNYVQTLRLHFYQSPDTRVDCAPLSHRMIQHTLGLIVPTLNRVKFVTVSGPPSMTIFEAISQLDNTQLRGLHVGSKWCNYKYISAPEDAHFDIYDWSKLNGLRGLRELLALQFTEEESTSLHRMIRSLPSLRSLGLAPRRTDLDLRPRSSPFQKVFGSNLAVDDDSSSLPNLLAHLPSTLRMLHLHEPFYVGATRLRIPEPPKDKDYNLTKYVLDNFLTEFDDLESTNNALKWLPSARLNSITYSPVLSVDAPEDCDNLGEPLNNINSIVSLHQQSLNEINITNAWKLHQDFADRFSKYWANCFQICELILGTDSIRSTECSLKHEQDQTQDLKHFLFGCSENINRWGAEIRRIRLELPLSPHHIDLEANDLMSYSSLQNLRILIIGPGSDCDPQTRGEEEHMKIAEALLEQASDTLRVIHLCRYTFWVDHYNDDTETTETNIKSRERRRLIPCDRTLAGHSLSESNLTRNSGFRNWLSIHDERFLDDNSKPHKRRTPFFGKSVPQSDLCQFWLQSFNFLVARPLGTSN